MSGALLDPCWRPHALVAYDPQRYSTEPASVASDEGWYAFRRVLRSWQGREEGRHLTSGKALSENSTKGLRPRSLKAVSAWLHQQGPQR